MTKAPILFWFRRDLRLSDHAGLSAAVATGRPVIPVFIHDEVVETYGAAPRWRLGLALAHFAKALEGAGSRLIFRRGRALETLTALLDETGADAIWWSRAYDPDAIARDKPLKEALKSRNIDARSFRGHLLFEPWSVETKTAGFYRVYTPFWNAVRGRDVPDPVPLVQDLKRPEIWPASDHLDGWKMGAAMNRGAVVVARHVCVGEDAAQARLDQFIAERVDDYGHARDMMAIKGTSNLSENLTYGEISIRTCWRAGLRALHNGQRGGEKFLKELVWREFSYHLAYHTPHITERNWREEWDAFPWNTKENAQTHAWKQGRTGIRLVDAAMREMYVTGMMHNRGRMIVASYLTKHLLSDWRIGKRWFEDCLIDWDPAANAMGWQWAAGSGPDAALYFRVFNPDTQAEKFDPDHTYRAKYLNELYAAQPGDAPGYFDAIPRAWKLSADMPYPEPIVSLSAGRARALEAYKNR